jgi:hypothetical protein
MSSLISKLESPEASSTPVVKQRRRGDALIRINRICSTRAEDDGSFEAALDALRGRQGPLSRRVQDGAEPGAEIGAPVGAEAVGDLAIGGAGTEIPFAPVVGGGSSRLVTKLNGWRRTLA